MIGKKRLSEVRANLLAECGKAGIDPATWFDEQVRKIESGSSSNASEIESLMLIRDGLQTVRNAKPDRKLARSRSASNKQ